MHQAIMCMREQMSVKTKYSHISAQREPNLVKVPAATTFVSANNAIDDMVPASLTPRWRMHRPGIAHLSSAASLAGAEAVVADWPQERSMEADHGHLIFDRRNLVVESTRRQALRSGFPIQQFPNGQHLDSSCASAFSPSVAPFFFSITIDLPL